MNCIANRFTAVLDACVLYPAPVRDLMLWIAFADIFRARWTNRIHEEWIEAVLKKNHRTTREALHYTKEKMNQSIPGCLVEEFEDLECGLDLPDADDRHVLAAAIKCSAHAIVTFNLRDFPKESLDKYGIEAIDPDDFTLSQLGLAREGVLLAAKRQRDNLKNPPKSIDEYLASLERCGLVQTASEFRRYREFL